MANKWVYMFSEGDMTMRNLLGGKGANLAEMTSIGLPVPQGFTITTEACTQYYEDGRKINDEIMAQAMEGVKKMEEINGKKFGDLENPLLVSVRSGARASMPGMMDTILNLGLNDEVVAAMIAGNPDPAFERFVYDSYRRFIQMFSDVVMEVGKKYFEQLIDKMKEERGVKFDIDLTAADLKELAEQFKAEYKNQLGTDFPSDPVEQLKLAIEAVFRSWDNPRANVYRRDNDIPYSWGTAVNVMPMVFGNLNNESGTGVAFTRDPATGENKLMGEFLINAQGEDVVAGVRTPMPIAQMEQEFPEAYAEFLKVCETLENHYHDMQDMEFTVENKKLYMLQCRNGKRTAPAALKIACDLVDEGHKTEEEAVLMIDPRNLDTLLHPQFDAAALKAATPLGKGLGASPGAACGKVVFTAEDAETWNARGEKVVLVRLETSPEDITGMKASQGILTVRGGMTSHAAVVARGMGTCCVSGCGDIAMDEENKKFTLAGKEFHEGDYISIDGTTGNIYDGAIKTVDATIAGEFGRVMAWADKYRTLKVRTNADTPADAKKARELGAEGIGLCRTEHMFFEEDRIAAFREMICSDTVEEREAALEKILPYQQGDFEALYEALEGNPVTIRFLDPPLHEFVPTEEADIEKLAAACKELGIALLLDEMYIEFTENYERNTAISLVNTYDNLIILRSVSKFFSVPGLRLAYAIMNNETNMTIINMTATPNSISCLTAAACTAMLEDTAYIHESHSRIFTERNLIYAAMNTNKNLRLFKPSANFALMQILKEDVTAKSLLAHCNLKGIVLRNCENFHGLDSHFVRFSIMNPMQNDLMVNTILELLR